MPWPAPLRLWGLQLLPLLAFLAVDALVHDPTWAIVAALGLVAVQGTVTSIRQRRLDRFMLLDALLIGSLGGISLISHNELFFKLKPAIMELACVPFMLVLALGNERLLAGYLQRYSAGVTLQPQALPLVRRMFLAMNGLVLLHAGLVSYAAFAWSRQAWGWISGPGFYLLLVPLFGWVAWRRWQLRREAQRRAACPVPSGRQAARRREST